LSGEVDASQSEEVEVEIEDENEITIEKDEPTTNTDGVEDATVE
jgi:hypothetical protein